MAEIARLSGPSDWIDLEFVERERTPSELMELDTRSGVVTRLRMAIETTFLPQMSI